MVYLMLIISNSLKDQGPDDNMITLTFFNVSLQRMLGLTSYF